MSSTTEEKKKIGSLKELHEALLEALRGTWGILKECNLYRVGEPDHDENWDYDYIYVEDDTEIRANVVEGSNEAWDGTYTVKDIHQDDKNFNGDAEFSCTGEQVVEYYVGKAEAWQNGFDCEKYDSFYNKGFRTEINAQFRLEDSYRAKQGKK